MNAAFIGDCLMRESVRRALGTVTLTDATQDFDLVLVGEGPAALKVVGDLAASQSAPVVLVTRQSHGTLEHAATRLGAIAVLCITELTDARLEALKNCRSGRAYLTHLAGMRDVANGLAHELNTPSVSLRANTAVLDDYFGTLQAFVRDLRTAASDGRLDAGAIAQLIESHQVDAVIKDGGSIVEENLQGITRIQATVEQIGVAACA